MIFKACLVKLACILSFINYVIKKYMLNTQKRHSYHLRATKAKIRLRIAHPDQGLRCPLTKSTDTVEYIDEQSLCWDCADAQAGLNICCSRMTWRPFALIVTFQKYLKKVLPNQMPSHANENKRKQYVVRQEPATSDACHVDRPTLCQLYKDPDQPSHFPCRLGH